jgi:hypothetical protein
MFETWSTKEFPVAVYIKMRGGRLLKLNKIPTQKFGHEFFFENTVKVIKDDKVEIVTCDELAIDYVNSECSDFDSCQRSLKKLCMSNRSNY